MRKKTSLLLCAAAFAFMLLPAASAGEEPLPWLRFSVDYWMSSIEAEAEYEGDRFSLDEDFSMSPRKDIPVFELGLDWSRTSGIFLSHVSPSYSGRDAIRRDISYGGVTFPAGTEVSYDLRMSFTDVLYRSSLAEFSGNRLDILFGVKIADVSLELEGTDAHPGEQRTVKEDVRAPVPLVGLWFSGSLPRGFSYELQGRGLTMPVEGYRFDILDANLMLNYEVHENFHVGAGYRTFIVNADVDDFEFKSSLDGFVLRGLIRY